MTTTMARLAQRRHAVARVLPEAAELPADAPSAPESTSPNGSHDLCPACGEATLVHREGCRSCARGFSECRAAGCVHRWPSHTGWRVDTMSASGHRKVDRGGWP